MLITGASRGIGEAIAKKFSTDGYELILLARTEIDLARVQKEIRLQGGKASYYVCDFSDSSLLEQILDKVVINHGFISHLVLNAGVSTNSEFVLHSMEEIKREMEINYFSVLTVIKKFLPKMIENKEGNIVTIGSVMSLLPFPANSSYAASKAALLSFSRSLRLELDRYKINVSAVLPGLTRTKMTEDFHDFLLPFDEPDTVAEAVKEAIHSKKDIVIPGLFNQAVVNLYNIIPEVFHLALGKAVEFVIPFIKQKSV